MLPTFGRTTGLPLAPLGARGQWLFAPWELQQRKGGLFLLAPAHEVVLSKGELLPRSRLPCKPMARRSPNVVERQNQPRAS